MLIKEQNFGVEIELTGLTRSDAAKVIANYFASTSNYLGGAYDAYGITDRKGRMWKVVSDSSIEVTHNVNGRQSSNFAHGDLPSWYKCEVVTPILQYEDIGDLQEVVRTLAKNGAVANSSCGIHIHVDGARHDAHSLIRLMNFAIGRQDLFYEALGISGRGNHWCKKMNTTLLAAMKADKDKTKQSIERIWYSTANDQYSGGIDHTHYNKTRYHGINLHAYFTKGTIEFRLFNGTTHAGKIKAYVQFCLAMSAWAIESKDKMYYKNCKDYTKEQKAKLMISVLKNRLGLKGAEFKNCRFHLTKSFKIENERTNGQDVA